MSQFDFPKALFCPNSHFAERGRRPLITGALVARTVGSCFAV